MPANKNNCTYRLDKYLSGHPQVLESSFLETKIEVLTAWKVKAEVLSKSALHNGYGLKGPSGL